MIRLAVIGEIGSGKSFVAKQLGYPVFNADIEVSKLYRRSKKCFNKLKKALPNHITTFPIKKSEISKSIISRQHNLEIIIKIIHPEVQLEMKKFLKKNKSKRIIVLDIPLLIENNINKKNDILIFVDAKKNEIYKRLKKRKSYDKKILKILKKFQLPIEIKKKKSDFIIKNNFKHNSVKKSVKILLEKILAYV
jgi:dephospho-CoA kinase